MSDIQIIFLILAGLNIIFAIAKWIGTGKEQVSAIAGWTCAILYCIK